jgi:hypothetical protein
MRIFARSLLVATILSTACTRPNQNLSVGTTAVAPPSTVMPDAGATASLWVTVTEVDVRIAVTERREDHEHGRKHDDDGDDDGVWVTLFKGQRQIDLLDATATEAFLAESMVPPGRVNAVKLILAPDALLVVNGQSIAIHCTTCTAGIVIVLDERPFVTKDGHLHLGLEFDLRASLLVGRDGLSLAPVVRLREAQHD